MEVIKREELLNDSVFNQLFGLIKVKHVSADHTIKVLQENKHVKDFCEIAVHFAVLPPNLFISYQTASWLKNNRVLVRFESVTIYDDQAEYLIERAKGMKDLTGFVEKN